MLRPEQVMIFEMYAKCKESNLCELFDADLYIDIHI